MSAPASVPEIMMERTGRGRSPHRMDVVWHQAPDPTATEEPPRPPGAGDRYTWQAADPSRGTVAGWVLSACLTERAHQRPLYEGPR